MLILTGLSLFPNYSSFLFAGGSDVLMEYAMSGFWVQTLFATLYLVTLIIPYRSLEKNKKFLLVALFSLWFLSGRIVSIFPDGRISTGWFYIETDKVNICENSIDCEKTVYYDTRLEKLSLWRIRIQNDKIDVVVFTGPFISSKSLNMLKGKFHNWKGKPNKAE